MLDRLTKFLGFGKEEPENQPNSDGWLADEYEAAESKAENAQDEDFLTVWRGSPSFVRPWENRTLSKYEKMYKYDLNGDESQSTISNKSLKQIRSDNERIEKWKERVKGRW